jgi:hypothetical protein
MADWPSQPDHHHFVADGLLALTGTTARTAGAGTGSGPPQAAGPLLYPPFKILRTAGPRARVNSRVAERLTRVTAAL